MEPNLSKYNKDLREEFLANIDGKFSRCYAGIKNCRFQYGNDSLCGTPFLLVKPENKTISLDRALQLFGVGNTEIVVPTQREIARYSYPNAFVNGGYKIELLGEIKDELGKKQYESIEHQVGQSLSLVELRVKKILEHLMEGIGDGVCLHGHIRDLSSIKHKN